MAISFSCSGCGKQYSVKGEFGGKKTRCKNCNTQIDIPNAAEADLDPPDIGFLDEEPARPAPAASPARSAPAVATSGASSASSAPSMYAQAAPPAPPVVAKMPMRTDAPSENAAGPNKFTSIHNARPGTAASVYAKSGMAARAAQSRVQTDDPSVNGMSVMLGTLFVGASIIFSIIIYAQTGDGTPFYVVPALVLLITGTFFVPMCGGTALASWVCYKLFSMPVPTKLYLRSIGMYLAMFVLTLPLTLISGGLFYLAVQEILPPAVYGVFNLVGSIINLIICFKVFTRFLDFTGLRTVIVMLISGVFSAILMIPSLMILGVISAAIVAAGAAADSMVSLPRSDDDKVAVSTSSTPPVETELEKEARLAAEKKQRDARESIFKLKSEVAELTRQISPTGVRESYASAFETIRGDYSKVEQQSGSLQEFADLKKVYDELDQKFALLPSREPDTMVYEKAPSGEVWDTLAPGEFRPRMSILGDLYINTPPGALMKLSGDPETNPQWESPDRKVTLSLSRSPRTDAKQEQPWIILPQMSLIARQKQLMYIVSDGRAFARGVIDDLVFTRGQRTPTESVPIASVRYVALDGDHWLVAEISSNAKDEQWFSQFETCVKSLKRMKRGEPHVSPFAPEFLVDRLADSPADAMDRLRKAGAAAEPALLPVASEPAHPSRVRALQLLESVGTEACKPLFESLAADDDAALYRPARNGLIRLDPRNHTDLGFAVQDLQLDYSDRTSEKILAAMRLLARAKPDERRQVVAPILEKVLLTSTPDAAIEPAAEALLNWRRPETVDALLPMVSNAGSENARGLDSAIIVLGASKDERVVRPILSWGIKRLDAVTKACVQLGALAEDDLIKMLSMNAAAKSVACDVLKQSGSQRALAMLERTARDRDNPPELQAKARDATIAIKGRINK